MEASRETLDRTTAGTWAEGTRLNLERSLALGTEMGGHYVTGHIDATVPIEAITADGDSRRYLFRAPADLAGFIASKGSVALDGVSLTVNEVDDAADGSAVFGVTSFRTPGLHHLRRPRRWRPGEHGGGHACPLRRAPASGRCCAAAAGACAAGGRPWLRARTC